MDSYAFGIVVLLVVIVGSLYFLFCYRKNGRRTSQKLPPSFPSLPFVGSLPFIAAGGDRLFHYFMEKASELGDVYTFNAGRKLTLVLNGREAIVEALVNRSVEFADRSPLWTEKHFLNNQLRGITFKHYNAAFKKYHAMTSSALNQSTPGDFSTRTGVRQGISERISRGVEMLLNEIIVKQGEAFDPKFLFNKFSGTNILGVLLGERFLRENYSSRAREIISSSDSYLENIDPVLDIMPWVRFLPVFRRKLEAMSNSSDVLLRTLKEEVEISMAENADESFAKRFAEMGCCVSEQDLEELVYIVRDLVFGATKTVATTLLWAVILLANRQDIQRRMREEIESVIPVDKLPSVENRDRLPFTEAVILEVLRRKCVAPFSSTHATIRDTEIRGFFVPAGCMVLVNLYSAHMNPKDWEDPEDFRPERFLNEGRIVKKELIIPFSLGIRSCIGETIALQEIFVLLCGLVRKFDIQPPKGTKTLSEEEKYQLVLSPLPCNICFIPRHDNAA